jgi:hypothetical protein
MKAEAYRLRRRLINRRKQLVRSRGLNSTPIKKYDYGFELGARKNRFLPKLQSFYWRGFKVTTVNNRTYGFKFEYIVQAVSQQAKALCFINKIPVVQNDYTSMPTIDDAKDSGKVRVNETLSINWSRHWHN